MELNKKLFDSLIILKSISNELQNIEPSMLYMWKLRDEHWNKTGKYDDVVYNLNSAMYGLLFMSIIRYTAFLDEYNKHFSKAGKSQFEKQAILGIKKVCEVKQNFFEAVTQSFPDIEEARHRILAHGYRTSSSSTAERLKSSEIEDLFNKVTKHGSPASFGSLSSVPFRVIEQIEAKFGEITGDVLTEDEEEEQETDNSD